MEYPLLIYTFINQISATNNLLLNKSATDNPLLKNQHLLFTSEIIYYEFYY